MCVIVYIIFLIENEGIYNFNQICGGIFVPQSLRAINLELSQSGYLYLVISIKKKKNFREKDFFSLMHIVIHLGPAVSQPESVLDLGAGLDRTDTGYALSSEFGRENKCWIHDYTDYKMIY